MTLPILEARDLRVLYGGAPVLTVPHLIVPDKETLALIGPNGAGKSTLLRILGFLERPTSGEVLFRGTRIPQRSRELLAMRRRCACVFQEALLCDATAEVNAGLGLRLRSEPASVVADRAALWLQRMGISHLAGRRARTLSGGEAQRVSLARAFAIQPEILLLDEPFAALDPPTRADLLTLLQGLLPQAGCTTIFVTHDREEALRLGDRMAVLIDGSIRQVGSPAEVFGRPATEEVARFVGVETILDGRIVDDRAGLLAVDVKGAKIEALGKGRVGERVLVCLRPEDVVIHRPGDPGAQASARNRLEGVIRVAARLEAQYRVEIACGPQIVALVTKQSFEEMGLGVGSRVSIAFKASAVHLLLR